MLTQLKKNPFDKSLYSNAYKVLQKQWNKSTIHKAKFGTNFLTYI